MGVIFVGYNLWDYLDEFSSILDEKQNLAKIQRGFFSIFCNFTMN